MRHVFIETNWVVDYAAPAHHQVEAALNLLENAEKGDIRLYLPSCCIVEAQYPIRTKFQPKQADTIRKFMKWSKGKTNFSSDDIDSARRVLDDFEGQVRGDLDKLNAKLNQLQGKPGLEIFPLDDAMLQRCVELNLSGIELKAHDSAILAAVLGRASQLAKDGVDDMSFCELDSDLWPWQKKTRDPKPDLKKLYDNARVWVYSDYTLSSPARPDGWKG